MRGSSTPEQLRVVESEPERLFRVAQVTQEDTTIRSSMPTGAWLEREGGLVPGGVLGVLMDNVLGYGVMVEGPAGQWSVTSEMSIDLCHPIQSGTRLDAHARPVHTDARGAITSGEVTDARGRLIAVGRQHGRFVADVPEALTHGTPAPQQVRASFAGPVLDALGAAPRATEGGAVLDLVTFGRHANPLGNMHGGITVCLVEMTALSALEATGQRFAAASIHVCYLRPIPVGTPVTFAATVSHLGRSFAVTTVEARTAEGKTCVTATVTAGSR